MIRTIRALIIATALVAATLLPVGAASAAAPATQPAAVAVVHAGQFASARWCTISWWDFAYYVGFGLSGWRWC